MSGKLISNRALVLPISMLFAFVAGYYTHTTNVDTQCKIGENNYVWDETAFCSGIDIDPYPVICKDAHERLISGKVIKRFPDGRTMVEMFVKDGKKDGVEKLYDENGKLEQENVFTDGKREGLSKSYYGNGILASEAHFEDDKLNGWAKNYHMNGVLKYEAFYKNGDQKIGKFYENGILASEVHFEGNKREVKKYYKNGQLKTQIAFKNDKKDGIAKMYDRNGRLIGEEMCKEGKCDGHLFDDIF